MDLYTDGLNYMYKNIQPNIYKLHRTEKLDTGDQDSVEQAKAQTKTATKDDANEGDPRKDEITDTRFGEMCPLVLTHTETYLYLTEKKTVRLVQT